jgi:hypothetical protein
VAQFRVFCTPWSTASIVIWNTFSCLLDLTVFYLFKARAKRVVTQLFEGLYVCLIVENLLLVGSEWFHHSSIHIFIHQTVHTQQTNPCNIEKSNTMTDDTNACNYCLQIE